MRRLCFATRLVLWVGVRTIAVKPRGKNTQSPNTATEQSKPAAPSDLDDPDLLIAHHQSQPVVNTRQKSPSLIASATKKQTHKPREPGDPGEPGEPDHYGSERLQAAADQRHSGEKTRKPLEPLNAPKINVSLTSGCQQHVYSLSWLKVLLIASSQSSFIHVCFRKKNQKNTKTQNNNDVTLLKCCTYLYTTQGDDTHTQTRTKQMKHSYLLLLLLPFSMRRKIRGRKREREKPD